MRYVRLGRSGLRVSAVGLGLWQVGSRLWGFHGVGAEEVVHRIVGKAYECGINLYDTAEVYGGGLSERLLGSAINKLGIRGEVVVASKVAGYRGTRESIFKAIEDINRRVGFKVDLIQHHWPPPTYTPLCRVVNAFEEAVDRGLAYCYGLSNYNTELLSKVLECCKKYEPVSNQVQYNLGYRVVENGLKPFMDKHGLTLIAWSPLAKGALAGLRAPRTWPQKMDKVFKEVASDQRLQEVLGGLAEKYGVTRSVVALAWLIHKGAIPIPGTNDVERVSEYSESLKVNLVEGDLELLDAVSSKYRNIWGGEYKSLGSMRLIPSFLQALMFKIIRGI